MDNNSLSEITLTPLQGNPDLVISLNRSNKFPDRDSNDYISEESVLTDRVDITQEML